MLGTSLAVLTVGCVARFANGWVFTGVNYTDLRAGSDTVNEQEEIEVRFIYPGTKWCGAGNVADGYEDLGSSAEADKCCREHDYCPDVISGGETKYNLTNDAFYSREHAHCADIISGGEIKYNMTDDAFYLRLSCQCDEKFRKCLRKARSRTASIIGVLYFNAIGTKCFRKDYPVIGCKRKGGFLDRKCLEYEFDVTGEKKYQWFDENNY